MSKNAPIEVGEMQSGIEIDLLFERNVTQERFCGCEKEKFLLYELLKRLKKAS